MCLSLGIVNMLMQDFTCFWVSDVKKSNVCNFNKCFFCTGDVLSPESYCSAMNSV